jgi:hypothetical protein
VADSPAEYNLGWKTDERARRQTGFGIKVLCEGRHGKGTYCWFASWLRSRALRAESSVPMKSSLRRQSHSFSQEQPARVFGPSFALYLPIDPNAGQTVSGRLQEARCL